MAILQLGSGTILKPLDVPGIEEREEVVFGPDPGYGGYETRGSWIEDPCLRLFILERDETD
ncbi:MAG: hypothetical protein GKC04_04095 [Methanomicrobiales archaeon]|nr:hypothetical protein [Methanomicrobiales archaeon]